MKKIAIETLIESRRDCIRTYLYGKIEEEDRANLIKEIARLSIEIFKKEKDLEKYEDANKGEEYKGVVI